MAPWPANFFGVLRQTGVIWRRKKPHFAQFLSAKQRIVSSTSRRTISMKFEHKTRIGLMMSYFRTEFRSFSEKGTFTSRNLILGDFGGTFLTRPPQPWPLGL